MWDLIVSVPDHCLYLYLKLNLITRYLTFEGPTSHFDAYVLRMRSD